MKYRHVFWAILLITIGVLFMLNNFGVIEFGFVALWSLWPLILILWGISILPIRDGIKITALVAVLALTVIFFNRLTENSFWDRFDFHTHRDFDRNWDYDDQGNTYNYEPQNLSVPLDSTIPKGILNLEAAAGKFNIEGVTTDFLSFNKTGDIGNYSLTTNDERGKKVIRLALEKAGIRHNMNENKVDIRLNQSPSWNLDLDIGAAEIDMDLRDYLIDSTSINAGASSIDIKIGERNPLTTLVFNAGASSISIEIPRSSGCQITSESFMVSKEFDGFNKTGNGLYETPNFKEAPNKIRIVIKTAVSKIEVTRI